ncbi:MAG: HAD family hydrolase [Anaerolineales bacterium]
MTITTILFDFDGTLRFNKPAGRDVFIDEAARLGVHITPEIRRLAARWEHYYWAESPELLADAARFPETDDFYLNYSRRQLIALGCSEAQAAALAGPVHAHMRANYQSEDWIEPGAPRVLEYLQKAGYRMGVVSNRSENFQAHVNRLGLGDFFAFTLSGGEAQSKKPDPGIFHHALRLAGSTPHQAMYVGDNFFADVVGARRAGVHPVLFDPREVFDDPGCTVIKSIEELPTLLERI